MTCILTDEELEEAIRSSDGTLRSGDRAIANAAARKALELAARECEKIEEGCDPWDPLSDANGCRDCADAIRELARGYE